MGFIGGLFLFNFCYFVVSCFYSGRGVRVCIEVFGRRFSYGSGRVSFG